MVVIGFTFIWRYFIFMAPGLNIYRDLLLRKSIRVILETTILMADSSDGDITLRRVFSSSLDPGKTWYALHTVLCCCKPSTFCSSTSAKLFADEYKLVNLADLYEDGGVPASYRWFCNTRRPEKVHVATAFGLVLGVLRLKSLADCPFLKSDYFKALKLLINSFQLSSGGRPESSHEIRLKSHIAAIEAQLSSAAKEILSLRSQMRCEQPSSQDSPPTPPCTPSPPKMKSPPNRKRPRTIQEINADPDLLPATKRKKIKETATGLMSQVNDLCERNGETLGTVLGQCCLLAGNDSLGARETIIHTFDSMVEDKGVRVAFSKLVSEEVWEKRMEEMRVPDWNYLLFKLKSRISDSAWQDLTNLTKLGRTGKKTDADIIILKNHISALRKGHFNVTRSLMGIECIPQLPGYEVNLKNVTVWIIRDMRLHGCDPDEVTFNLKIDGRPFFGKSQVTFGIVPLDARYRSSQSAKSVYPLAIANCKEKRDELRKLFVNLNKYKDELKRNGIRVDGKHYRIKFKVTLDYKGLLLLMAKIDDEEFLLGGHGLAIEFCLFCMALRACDCDLGTHEVCLEHFLQTKANVGGFKGLRDDLTCILDEELSSMCLCALHCEMRNTEQLLKSVGLLAYNIGSLKECNEKLSTFGPENFDSDRITVKLRPGQQTAPGRNNISVASCSGNTERKILSNIEDIVEASLPSEKLQARFKDQEAAKLCVLNKISFCERRQTYYSEMLKSNIFIRDFGERLEEIKLTNSAVGKDIQDRIKFWKVKKAEIEGQFKVLYKPTVSKVGRGRKSKKQNDHSNELSRYAGTLTKEFLTMVCSQWKEIALINRDREFKEDEEHLIDIFDVQCKEWGFLLLEMFGSSLGTGDYGHLTVEHVPMLFRVHRSLHHLSNQGFEAAHKLQRQLYAKATSHDSSDNTASLDQILTHLYTEMMLDLRLSFKEAKNCFNSGNLFYYRGCGWKPKKMNWSGKDRDWINKMDQLLDDLFGPEFCHYEYTESKHCVLVPGQFPLIQYDHNEWENTFGSKDDGSNPHGSKDDSSNPRGSKDDSSKPPGSKDDSSKPHGSKDDSSNPRGSKDDSSNPCGSKDDGSNLHGSKDDSSNPQGNKDDSSNPCGSKDDGSNLHGSKDDSSNPQGSKDDSSNNHDREDDSSNPNGSEDDSGNPNGSKDDRPSFKFNSISHLTRCERASVKLPKVVFVSPKDVELVEGDSEVTDPELVNMRPSETTVQHAKNLITSKKSTLVGDGDLEESVKIGIIGTFTTSCIKIFQNMCTIHSDASKLRQERNWLSKKKDNLPAIIKIRDVLENSRPRDEILRQGQFIMDVSDFTTLACERYVNSFTMDAVCLKLQQQKRPTKVVYLPTYSQIWARQGVQYFSGKVKQFFAHCAVQDAMYILSPVYFETPKHWGLLCFESSSRTIYFDDGLKISPPRDTSTVIKNMLGGFKVLSNSPNFDEHWNQSLPNPLPRMNMPTQTKTGVGAGSCGVGVILAVRDVISSGNCLPPFHWRFENMDNLRIELMTLILQWRS